MCNFRNIQDHDGHDDNRGTHSSSRRESLYPEQAQHSKLKNRRMGDDAITTGLSALYCKFLVILGVAMPITEIISEKIPTVVYQSFYVYMYGGSILFVVFVYTMTFKNRALFNIVKNYREYLFRVILWLMKISSYVVKILFGK